MARVNKFLKMAGGGEVKKSYREADGDLLEERFDCGTGAGGFQPGNSCAGGDGASEINSANKPKISVSQKGSFLQAETQGGIVGGNIKDGAIKISVADLTEDKQGKGIGKEMYRSLIDKAHSKGLKVYSDSTVEVSAVRVYQSLGRDGYEIVMNDYGVIPPSKAPPLGAWFGIGGKSVFEVKPKTKQD
jgi:GNAT superfamily N-acetyltransferase